MKRYRQYMDEIKASDTLRQRLRGLETSAKRPVPWKKYGTAAAALVLAVGVGVWGLSGGFPFAANRDLPRKETVAESDIIGQPDIAVEDPGDVTEPGEKTLGGYDVTVGSGENAVAAHYILPYIDYGEVSGGSQAAQVDADWGLPKGAAERDLDRDEIIALLGGEDAVNTHLNWGGYELTGWGAWYEDGSFWGAYLQGYAGPLDHFEFAVTADQLPPTCFGYPTSVTQEIRGLTVTADGHDGKDGCSRRVSFMKGDYGYRFDLTATDTEQAELLVSRLVCRIADKGLALTYDCPYCGHTFPFGSVHNDPLITAEMVYTCSICGQTFPVGTVHNDPDIGAGEDGSISTEPYDPRKAADPSYNVPASPDDITCSGYPVPAGPDETHICPICGAILPADVEHAHADVEHTDEICGLPLAPPDTAIDTIYD